MSKTIVTWSVFKGILDSYKVNFFYSEEPSLFRISSFAGQQEIGTMIFKDGGTDHNDFVANYKSKGNKPITPMVPALGDPDSHRFRGKRIISVTINQAETALDYTLSEELFLTGFIVKAYNPGNFDYAKFQVVAPIGHVVNPTGSEIVLEEFVSSWGISSDLQHIEVYKAKILSGLKLRIIYFKSTESSVDLWINAFLHKKV